jgi:copper chaperone CopZ
MRMIMFLWISLGLAVPAYAQESQVPLAAEEALRSETILVQVNGLVCDFCARALEKIFAKREEVASFSVDLTSKVMTLGLKPGQVLDDAAIAELVKKAGYNVVKIERK